jgi:3',5'-cyclic AMP phosphodiesterase CpdA
MFVLAHLSDVHLSAPPRPIDLIGKRGLGFINWQRGRKHVFSSDALETITADVKASSPAHIAVTGDLVNLSLAAEYARAKAWLDGLGSPADVTVIPGNHDVYVTKANSQPAAYWGDYMVGDDRAAAGTFPFLRRRGPLALIALSTALPTGAFLATGELGAAQLAALADMLDQTRDRFRVVLIHHPPVSPPSRHMRRLVDAAEFRRVLAEKGAELVLHGHDHCFSLVWLDGPQRQIPAAGVPSAAARAAHGGEHAAGYNLFHIGGEAGAWRCDAVSRQRGADGTVAEIKRQTLLTAGLQPAAR